MYVLCVRVVCACCVCVVCVVGAGGQGEGKGRVKGAVFFCYEPEALLYFSCHGDINTPGC